MSRATKLIKLIREAGPHGPIGIDPKDTPHELTPQVSGFTTETPKDYTTHVMDLLTGIHGGSIDPEEGHASLSKTIAHHNLTISQLAELKKLIAARENYELSTQPSMGSDELPESGWNDEDDDEEQDEDLGGSLSGSTYSQNISSIGKNAYRSRSGQSQQGSPSYPTSSNSMVNQRHKADIGPQDSGIEGSDKGSQFEESRAQRILHHNEGILGTTAKIGTRMGAAMVGGHIGATLGAPGGLGGVLAGRMAGVVSGIMAHHLISHAVQSTRAIRGAIQSNTQPVQSQSGQYNPSAIVNPTSQLSQEQQRRQSLASQSSVSQAQQQPTQMPRSR